MSRRATPNETVTRVRPPPARSLGYRPRPGGLLLGIGVLGLLVVLLGSSMWVGAWATLGVANPPRSPHSTLPMEFVAAGNNGGSVKVTVHNTMSNATGAYQQPIHIDSAALNAWINSNWSNGRVYSATSGTPLYAWIESGASNRSNDTLLWVRMASIPAGGWSNLTISFGPLSTFDLSPTGYIGEAPELSNAYGAFDNGASVFDFYDNFSGTHLSSVWAVNGAWNYSVQNGFNYSSVPGSGASIYSKSTFSYPEVEDFFGNLYETDTSTVYNSEGLGTSSCVGCGSASEVAFSSSVDYLSINGPTPTTETGSNGTRGTTVSTSQQFGVFTSEAVSTSQAIFEFNYSSAQTLTTNIPNGPLPVGLAFASFPSGSLQALQTTLWIRERAYVATIPTVTVSGIPVFGVTFVANGLPWGASWSVHLGHNATSTGPIAFLVPNGTYSYTVGAIAGYTESPSSGNLTVAGASQTVTIRFATKGSTPYYAVDFTETGLASGSTWSVSLNGTDKTASASTLGFTEPNGSYAYSVDCGANYTASPAKGTVSIAGSIAAVAVVCQNKTGGFGPLRKMVFEAAGLPNALSWSVMLSPDSTGLTVLVSVTRSAVGDQSISFQASVGNYSYEATALGYGSQSGTVNTGAAPTTVVSVSFAPIASTTSSPHPLGLTEFWAIGIVLIATGALGLGATAYRMRARRVDQGRAFVRGIAETEWANDGSGGPEPRINP